MKQTKKPVIKPTNQQLGFMTFLLIYLPLGTDVLITFLDNVFSFFFSSPKFFFVFAPHRIHSDSHHRSSPVSHQ